MSQLWDENFKLTKSLNNEIKVIIESRNYNNYDIKNHDYKVYIMTSKLWDTSLNRVKVETDKKVTIMRQKVKIVIKNNNKS